ncbi:1,4-alpha-glucan branching protein GlgB [Methylomicrobium sp. Wu6]|uniref:1,4-alpha-glucan branching protein GlgB n=1 Tax=Methylomicrobium sp. Wu6 TaxID=3107928 RepID=UPI002DD688B3|nr:1,4-alpha-glucan branching protein GlgB [Methylomicrobium sp. Wu6]MEC4748923.1 1,4-alpha-glucan branching protein GlgB [Methylomicrobium sp. Wu6]
MSTLTNFSVEAVSHASLLTDLDIYLFKQGSHFRLYEKLGSHLVTVEGVKGCSFAVWAPNASAISVIGEFNQWDATANVLHLRDDGSGIWEGFIADVMVGAGYKYRIVSRDGKIADKGDPFAFCWEMPPLTASRVWELDYAWNDAAWMPRRGEKNQLNAPCSIYEVHLGSWRRVPEDGNRFLTYREMAEWLPRYLEEMNFTHVEFMPVTEHPFYGSWGYETTGYFAPTARYGTPQDFMFLVDTLHQQGIGVILDWVPAHFPGDAHGLGHFDGTYLYEHADPRQGYQPDWHSSIFNYGRHEVGAFLTSSAMFWLDKYHIDGLRIDAVSSMLYLDFGRKEGEWIPNRNGGRENLDAVSFLRHLNEAVYREYPDTQTFAEESTAWPMVSRPVSAGGLGFGLKWNMGWMHDTLRYFSENPLNRKYHHGQLVFSIWYAFSENFVLPISHDEVVHGQGSLIGKMPGDEWQQFANLRLLYGFMWGHPGKKLLFMGCEFGQKREWQHDESLEWQVLQYSHHDGLRRWVADLNRFYRSEPALYLQDFSLDGFQWLDCNDAEKSVLSFIRRGLHSNDTILVVCNFTPVVRENYRVGAPSGGVWHEVLNSDAECYGGSGAGNLGAVEASPVSAGDMYHSLMLRLPPLGVLFFRQGSAS